MMYGCGLKGVYIRYNPNPVLVSHMGVRKRMVGFRFALRHLLEDRMSARDRRDRT
jgi:hypothetical protein